MTRPEKEEIYKCDLCGNMAEILKGDGAPLFCCGRTMDLQEEQTADATKEKHVPIIKKIDGGYKITVGNAIHPMEKEHFIKWIELKADGKSYKQFLKLGDTPEAIFKTDAINVSAREYCSLHGLWKKENCN
ncbi:MAG: desulfoferrodoxin [Alphaproteobacteria bacterium]|nr:desulfoferrodoxin [Alphaproteobacteria bacterium]